MVRKAKGSSSKKGFRAYYLLVVSIILLTIAIQTIVQYSLDKQRNTALIVNLAGRQRMLSQRLLNEVYSCRYHNCDYAELRLTINKLLQMHFVLQEGSDHLGIEPLNDAEIAESFKLLQPSVIWFQSNLTDLQAIKTLSFNDLRYRVDRFLTIMDDIVLQFQKKSENDIKAMRIVELELAIFSVLIVLFEIIFIVNPIFNRIINQKKKLTEIAWHQSHVLTSHMKNIRELLYVIRVEKNRERRDEIVKIINEELDQIGEVSQTVKHSLKKNEHSTETNHKVLKKLEYLLERLHILPAKEVIDDDMVHSSK